MTDSARTPFGGNQIDNEKLIAGYGPLSEFLTSEGLPISKSSLQKIGAPSAGGDLPIEGYWGNLPIFRPSKARVWARSKIRPSRGKAAAPAPMANEPSPAQQADSAPTASF